MQVNRLFEIVYILLEKKAITARQLSEQFGVSQRTIYRDIDALSLAGIPVYTEKGKGGGIGLLPEFVLNKSILSEQEQLEILSALQALSGVRPAETEQVLKKMSALFNKTASDWLQVDFSDWNSSGSKFFNSFKDAIFRRQVAEFDYYGTSGEKTRRRVEPVQLLFKSKAWYVYGFCLTRREMRVFRLTRVKNLRITNKRFSSRGPETVRADFKEEKHEKLKRVCFRLKIAPEAAYRVFDEFDETMTEKQPDGGYIVSVKWPNDHWVYGFIMSFGEHIEVLEPESARKIIKNKTLKIQKKYL